MIYSVIDRRPLTAGAAFFLLAALADGYWTLKGLRGDASLEGNPVLRALMVRYGLVSGLLLGKAATGAACVAIAWFCEPEIRRGAPWIDKIPSTRWAREWMKRGDRAWIAFVPLYGTALAQLFGAVSWAVLLDR